MERRTTGRRFAVVTLASLLALSVLPLGSASAKPARARAVLPDVVPVEPDALTEALEQGQLSQAEYTLHRARSVFVLGEVRDEFGDVERADAHAATLILRDLALRTESLSSEDKALAVDILERPSQGGSHDPYLEYTVEEAPPIESPHFRIHYVTTTRDESSLAYATEISALMEHVWAQEVDAHGWVAPKSDGARGGDDKFDVYLGNVGANLVYGYCSTDLRQTGTSQHSYCVLDNGFTEFPGPVTGADAARVTAAHEFNHALQFTYDVTDDYWLSEASATWMEDEVFDSINDNYQYLVSSSLGRPRTPADTWTDFSDPNDPDTGFQYGQFIWMKYLAEASGTPSIVREIWEEAAKPGVYSLEAMEAVLGGSRRFADSFAGFAAANADPSSSYEEGVGYEARVPTVPKVQHTIAEDVPVKGGASGRDHLTSRYISFTPGRDVPSDAQLSIAVDMGSAPMQRARVVSMSGSTSGILEVGLTDGEGSVTVPFGTRSEVVLVLTNGSNRMANCTRWFGSSFSCGGTPVHDDRAATYSAVTGLTAVDPGEPVERDAELGPRVLNFRATPEVFTPDGDGRKDRTTIAFDLFDDSKVTLALMRNGSAIGYLYRNDPLKGGYRYWRIWDGRKPSGQRVRNGTYTLKLKAVGPSGTTNRKTSVTVRR